MSLFFEERVCQYNDQNVKSNDEFVLWPKDGKVLPITTCYILI